MGLLTVSWWKQQTMAQMFRGQSTVTYLLIANNAAQVWGGDRVWGMFWLWVMRVHPSPWSPSHCAHATLPPPLFTMPSSCNAQGILSSFFFKFADTILKKYSSTIATIFTAVMSYVMFGHELSINFPIGVSIVLISMHQARPHHRVAVVKDKRFFQRR